MTMAANTSDYVDLAGGVEVFANNGIVVSEKSVYNFIVRQKVPTVRIGRKKYTRRADLEKALAKATR